MFGFFLEGLRFLRLGFGFGGSSLGFAPSSAEASSVTERFLGSACLGTSVDVPLPLDPAPVSDLMVGAPFGFSFGLFFKSSQCSSTHFAKSGPNFEIRIFATSSPILASAAAPMP